jgi:hypothetical protein
MIIDDQIMIAGSRLSSEMTQCLHGKSQTVCTVATVLLAAFLIERLGVSRQDFDQLLDDMMNKGVRAS